MKKRKRIRWVIRCIFLLIMTVNCEGNNISSDFTDGGKIVFLSERDGSVKLYVMETDGKNQKKLTNNNPVVHIPPCWSPNGKNIIFISKCDNNDWEIYIIDADGGNEKRLTYSEGLDEWPAWSPDGKKIVFGSSRGKNYEIYVMDADGNNQINLTKDRGIDNFPSWSPDGKKIVYESIQPHLKTTEIYMIDPDGKNKINLTNTPDLLEDIPIWSPDGKKIAFSSQRRDDPKGNHDIYIMDNNGDNQTRLTNLLGFNTPCQFSPDSKDIICVHSEGKYWEIYILNIKTKRYYRLLKKGMNGGDACWSPDGQKIVFTSFQKGKSNIYIVDRKGRNLKQLTTEGGTCPFWRLITK